MIRTLCSHRPSLSASSALALACATASVGALGCTSLATSPSWTGGGVSEIAPLRAAREEAASKRERERDARLPSKIGAKHMLVMHVDSARKPEGVSRTRAEAKKRAEECLLRVRSGEDFEAVVAECTDEPGGVERGGDLGVFDKKTMVKPFTDVAFELQKGEVSEVVETPFGFHVIKRTE
jgi:NIMA-interacting peptidyl-prolyl cis-trans isomerase 1